MENDKYTVDDMIVSAIQQKPDDFGNVFNNLIVDRLQTAVENRKQELAQNMFSANEVNYGDAEEYYDAEDLEPEEE